MPKRYHIEVHETPHRYPVIGKSGIVDWGEGCLKCARCVKLDCVYDVYRSRSFSDSIMADTIDELCRNCFRCVQGCPKRLIHKTVNPEWDALGDELYTPEIMSVTWEQARSGKIPVSGAGYGGPFAGPGFDSMWTDMSEIVRPTRDGIHGREYISTVVDMGRRPARLTFDEDGNLQTVLNPLVRIPLPIVFDILPFGDISNQVLKAMATAAGRIGTRMFVRESDLPELDEFSPRLVPVLEFGKPSADLLSRYDMVEIPDSEDVFDRIADLKGHNPSVIVSIRMPALSTNVERATHLALSGAEVLHFVADDRGHEPGIADGLHISEVIRKVHSRLVEERIRDETTFMVTGGIAMAEHVIKSMLCGANLVGVDVPLLIALECRVCRNCVEGGPCPVQVSNIDPAWGSNRIVNLMAAWHNQLLEMMGAMGIREARRLRGEQGRIMFFEDLEADTFARLFGPSA